MEPGISTAAGGGGNQVNEEQVWVNGERRLDTNTEHEGQGKHKGKDKTANPNKLADL